MTKTARTIPFHVAAAIKETDNPDKLLKGVQKYLLHPYQREELAAQTIWQHGPSQVFFYPTKKRKVQTNLFLVPSLINGPEIFDLHPDYSFVNALNKAGINVYLLDWGDLCSTYDASFSLHDLQTEIVLPAVHAAINHAQISSINILGYCLGGTLLADICPYMRDKIERMVLLAAPMDCRRMEAPWTRVIERGRIVKLIAERGVLSQRMLQTFFTSMRSGHLVAEKYERFLNIPDNDKTAEIFVAAEDWVNEGSDIPAKLAEDIIRRYFEENILVQDKPELDGMPLQIIASTNDRLVPSKTAIPAHSFSEDVTVQKPKCGHVGMMTGATAETDIWQPIINFLTQK